MPRGENVTGPLNLESHMATQRASHRKSNGAENGSLAPIALAIFFGEEHDIMGIDSLVQSLKKTLEEKIKKSNQRSSTWEAD